MIQPAQKEADDINSFKQNSSIKTKSIDHNQSREYGPIQDGNITIRLNRSRDYQNSLTSGNTPNNRFKGVAGKNNNFSFTKISFNYLNEHEPSVEDASYKKGSTPQGFMNKLMIQSGKSSFSNYLNQQSVNRKNMPIMLQNQGVGVNSMMGDEISGPQNLPAFGSLNMMGAPSLMKINSKQNPFNLSQKLDNQGESTPQLPSLINQKMFSNAVVSNQPMMGMPQGFN